MASHFADDLVVAFAFYNVGIKDNEFRGAKLKKKEKEERLKSDIKATFDADVGIQALFISEFGLMHENCLAYTEMTYQIFEELIRDIHMTHLVIKVLPPYVAIVDPNYWSVLDCFKCGNLCSRESNFAMMLSLEHTQSRARMGVANCHIPSTSGSTKRKHDTVVELCKRLATLDNLSGWIIGGDCNLDINTVKLLCLDYLEPGVPCISSSGANMELARKADFAITSGLNLQEVRSWVGFNFGPHASDCHNPILSALSRWL